MTPAELLKEDLTCTTAIKILLDKETNEFEHAIRYFKPRSSSRSPIGPGNGILASEEIRGAIRHACVATARITEETPDMAEEAAKNKLARRQSSAVCRWALVLCGQRTRGGTCARLPRHHPVLERISVGSRLLSCT